MTLLRERMEKAGVNTAESRLAALTVICLQESHGSVAAATEALWKKLSAEPWVVKEMFLRPYVAERHSDMRGIAAAPPQPEARTAVCPPPTPPVVAPLRQMVATPSPERKQAVAKIVAKAVEVVRFKSLTRDGRDWSQVRAYELGSMDRDGTLARSLKERLGALSNSQTNQALGELMTAAVFNEVRASVKNISP